ncbi:MAG: FAD-dependent oxidoreductase [Candidatus Lokiarchaeota archaeon]|nr:FAD-dependent oxidoreductase [Candidatus Lokiarchaeota archaeon]
MDYMEENVQEWPYPVKYGEENEVNGEVLVLGGGVAGCFAAISAANKGSKVILVDKGPILTSGSGGAGVDHWNFPCTGEFCNISPEKLTEIIAEEAVFDPGIQRYIQCKESYDCILDVEKWGLPLRDVDDEFKDTPFRDEKTKLLFAYDYEQKYIIRVRGGAKIKKYYYEELKRLKVPMYERIMVTSLLTEGGKQSARVIGATGLNARTGEFYIFKAKAVILCMSIAVNMWVYTFERIGAGHSFLCPTCTGEGFSIAWDAGAELTLMERSFYHPGQFQYPFLGTGYHEKTWYPTTIIDSNGKEIPWVDRSMNTLPIEKRSLHAPRQKISLVGVPIFPYKMKWKYAAPMITPNLPNMIKKGEVKLPLYADLPGMPEEERRVIFGLMVGNEGKTRIPVFQNYSEAGFDPEKDLLQVPVHTPDHYLYPAWFMGDPPAQYRSPSIGSGGLFYDWDLKTNLEGLFVAGMNGWGGLDHSQAAATGRYAGRKATEYARNAPDPIINRDQVNAEKNRVYAPVNRDNGIGWNELMMGITGRMQEFCGEYKHENTLNLGLTWLNEIKEVEAQQLYARNPRELVRALECLSMLKVGEIILNASLLRKGTDWGLGHIRLDYPKKDMENENKLIVIKKEENQIKSRSVPVNYHVLPPNAPKLEENYVKHSGL